ncbi:MAG TPA: helix-turn-helix transcriptional regulator [Terriglobia bacterium]|nr:helix-turn-helix transcriptional regulator [Terriglobia bacterium]
MDIESRLAIILPILKDAAYRQRCRDFLERLRQARRDAHLTQVQVSRRLPRPQSFVSKCESGERTVDTVELQEFARLYDKMLNFFVS